MRNTLIAAFAAVMMVAPTTSAAGDGDRTVRLVIECSPKTADAIQHLLKGLPAKVYRAEPVGTPRQAPAAPSADPRMRPMPTGVVSVLPIWNAIESAANRKDVGALTIDKMVISARGARVTVLADDPPAIARFRAALQGTAALSARARNSNFVELGAIASMPTGQVRGDLNLAFRPIPNAEGAKVDTPGLDLAAIGTWRDEAQLKPFRVGREQRDFNRAAGSTHIGSEWVFEETTLPRLKRFLTLTHAAKGLVPTEVRWQLLDPKQRLDDTTKIQKPSIKLEQWMVE